MITTLRRAIGAVWHTLRFHNWWNAKTPVLLTIFFAACFLAGVDVRTSATHLLPVLVWLIAAAAFGHYVNDIFDLEDDLAAGKPNTTSTHSGWVKVLIAGGLAALAVLPWVLFDAHRVMIPVVVAHLLIFLLYSSRPLRLKERGWIGVLTDSLYAHVLPGIVVLLAVPTDQVGVQHAVPLALFVAWQALSGVRNILNHQFEDHENDRLSGTRTIATVSGARWVRRFVKRALFAPEVVVFYALAIHLPRLGPVLVIGHVGYTLYVYVREVSFRAEEERLGTIERGRYDFLSGVVLNEFYEKWMPLFVLVTLSVSRIEWLAAIAVHLLLFPSVPKRFHTDFKYVVLTLSHRAYWWLEKLYYNTFMRIKHEIYWSVVRLWRRRQAVRDFLYFRIWLPFSNYVYYKVWLPFSFLAYYKVWGRVKHYIYWKILHADLEPDDDERPGERSVDR